MDQVLNRVDGLVKKHKLKVIDQDLARPWGGFLVLDENQIDAFANIFFPELDLRPVGQRLPMSPKFLMVAPQKRLSWQYHDRRGETWVVLDGPVAVGINTGDEEVDPQILHRGGKINFDRTVRHRLIGLDTWGVVAEIWMHTDHQNPSDEADIVRVQDDFARN